MDDVRAIGVHRIVQIAQSPTLAVLFLFTALAFVIALKQAKLQKFAIGLLVFLAIPAPAVDFWGNWLDPPFPLNQLVLYARTFTAMLVVLMSVLLLIDALTGHRRTLPPPLIWLFAMQAYLCFRLGVDGSPNEAVSRLLVYSIIFVGLGYALPTVWRDRRDLSQPVIAMVIAISLYAICTAFEMAFYWDRGFRQNRWLGITGNPNHAGMVGAIFCPAVLGLLGWKLTSKPVKIGLLFLLSFLVVQTMLTGSRGAILTAIIGVLVFYRTRIGPFIFAAIPVAIITMVFLNRSDTQDLEIDRLVSTENTRGHVLAGGLETFLENPIFGNASGGFHFIENAYLAFVMKTGIPGMFLLAGAMIAVVKLVLRSLSVQASFGPHASLVNAGIAGIAAIGANSMIEATFLANLNQTIFAIYLYVTLLYLAKVYADESAFSPPQ